jgi:uncharacterized protein YdaU (DUF1376 family)
MHYYKRNIGDYHKKAGRLSILEHGAYTLLIDACYDRERFPTVGEAIDWAWASTEEEKLAVESVLRRFFTLEDGVYVQGRIMEEIAAYHENSKINKRIAIDREEKKRSVINEACTKREPTVNEPPPNHKPLTINQEPLREKQAVRKRFKAPTPEEVLEYASGIGFNIDHEYFVTYYTAQGWKLSSGVAMKDWQATVQNWKRREAQRLAIPTNTSFVKEV